MNKLIYIVMGIQVIAGVFLTFFLKLMDKQIVDGEPFNQVYLQTCISFIGQAFNFIIYFAQKARGSDDSSDLPLQLDQESTKKKDIPYFRILIPAFFHGSCSITGFAAYYHMKASISMMIGGTLPLVTAVLSFFILRKQILRHQFLGMGIILIGSSLLGLQAVQSEESMPGAIPSLGLFLSVLSIILFGLLMISEEIVLKDYQIPGPLLAGFEGMFAFILSVAAIPIINLIFPGFVDFGVFFDMISKSNTLLIGAIGLVVADMIYTLFCILLTKYSSALTRSVVYQLRITGVWILCLCLSNPENLGGGKWETFSFVQLAGYILIGIGASIFQEFLKIKYCGFTKDIGAKEQGEPNTDYHSQTTEAYTDAGQPDSQLEMNFFKNKQQDGDYAKM